ncbi:hypothetical protein [Streptomyces sp. EAS-AB2608]|uniref:hypothetical protein n=1 Tax=Streptomyces sp. EAS-AB2608 TaxID=2779671 RepID=UPI001C852750|nr:hypothetical protein [Streptomyces sp. EAS-AB2608]
MGQLTTGRRPCKAGRSAKGFALSARTDGAGTPRATGVPPAHGPRRTVPGPAPGATRASGTFHGPAPARTPGTA